MKAAWYIHNGAARDVLTIGQLPDPQPSENEVRVRLHTSGVNPSDVKSRANRPVQAERIVPHSDGAGIIEAVGPGVDPRRLGERVWLWNGQWQRSMGTACDYIALPERQAVTLPDHVDFEMAACFGIPALTAIQAIHLAGNIAGKTVLVTGAGNAVGHYVTQLATLKGATVIGTAGSEARRLHAAQAGAAHIINYKTGPVAQQVAELTNGQGADAIIDMDFSSTASRLPDGVLKPHGSLICYGSNDSDALSIDFRTMLWKSINLKFFLVYDLLDEDRGRAINELTALLQSSLLRHTVSQVFSLGDIAAAHELVESGATPGTAVIRLI